MAWNPQARRQERFPIEASIDPVTGEPQAHVTMTSWTASDRLAYMNLTGRSIRKAKDGSRTVDVGELTLDHIARTITSAEGFGDVHVLDPRSGVLKTQPFDPRNRDHLEALSADVLEELAEYAEKVQPTRKRKADESEGDDVADEDGIAPVAVDTNDDAPPVSPVPGGEPAPAASTFDGPRGGVVDPSRA